MNDSACALDQLTDSTPCAACSSSFLRVTFAVTFQNSGITAASFSDSGMQSSLQDAIATTLGVPASSVIIESVTASTTRMRALTANLLVITFRVEAPAAALAGLQATFSSDVSSGTLGTALSARGLTPSSISTVTMATVAPAPAVPVLTVGVFIGRGGCVRRRLCAVCDSSDRRGTLWPHAGIAIGGVLAITAVAYCLCCRKKKTVVNVVTKIHPSP
jgi:hypothetical protein